MVVVKPMPKIMKNQEQELVFCGVPEGAAEMERLFAESYRLVTCLRMHSAKSCITSGTEIIICGTQFDDGAMFDLLRYTKAIPHLRPIPFLCVRIAGGRLEEALFESVAMSSMALGAAGFIDLFRWRREFGPEETDRKFRQLIDRLAAGAPDMSFEYSANKAALIRNDAE